MCKRHLHILTDFTYGLPRVILAVKNLPANTKDIRDLGSIPGSGRTPGEENRKILGT